MDGIFLIVEVVLGAAACVLLVPSLVFAIEIVAASFAASAAVSGRMQADVPSPSQATPLPDDPSERASVAVIMPAHDEASGIAAAMASVLPQLHRGDRLLVVADNCSDDTARIARELGAEVLERVDATRRGKGYALDAGVRHLASAPPGIVVMVDADCTLHARALDGIVRMANRRARPVQALYLMHALPGAGLRTRMAEFAWAVRNHARPLGLRRLGLPCQLMGTGMAFPWALIVEAGLASGHLVEDLQLGLALTADGAAPQFCAEALVTSTFPDRAEAAATQRARWEQGHLSMIATQGARMLWRSLWTRRIEMLASTLDLCVPPLASLVLALSVVVVLAAAAMAAGGAVWPFVVSVASFGMVASAVLLAWHRFGRQALSLRELLTAPLYALRKIPAYGHMLLRPQSTWVRTQRGDSAPTMEDHVGPRP